MSHSNVDRDSASHWLKSYYFARAGVAIAWVAGAFTIGKAMPPIAAALLVAYPAWDAAANFIDAQRNGGLIGNPSQSLNVVTSVIAAIAVALTLGTSMNAVLGVFGVWAVLAGLFQLITGVRRWRMYGAQWAMMLAGAQSAIVGAVFIKQANTPAVPSITDIAPYAAPIGRSRLLQINDVMFSDTWKINHLIKLNIIVGILIAGVVPAITKT